MHNTLYITGGSSGIGKAIANLFESKEYDVVNFDLHPGDVGHWEHVDVTEHDQLQDAVSSLAKNKPPSVLVCNAGKHLSASITNTPEQAFMDILNLNIKAVYSMCQVVLPFMQKNRFGRVILIGSDQSIIAKPNSFAYCTSKHALAGMTKSMALDFAKDGITVNAICPGTIDTPLYRNAIENYSQRSGINLSDIEAEEAAQQPVKRVGTANEVAEYALFLASKDAGYITGSLQMIDGGYTAR